MFFATVITYFVILSTSSTLYKSGHHEIASATEAAEALRPLAGDAAGFLFALGIVGVGFLAVPVIITGAAYDLSQALGWKHSLHAKPREAKRFYGANCRYYFDAAGMNFIGINYK